MRRGSVTVFLALVFSCMMVFISTFFRLAKVRLAEASGERLLKSSLDSALTEYDRELFRDYKLFFLPDQTGESARWDLKVKEYINGNLLGNISRMKLEEVEVKEKVYATDYGNEAVKHQIYQWMQYEIAPTFIERLIGDAESMQIENKALEEIKDEIKDAVEDASYNQDALRLLMCVEGIQTSDTGLCYGSNKKLKSVNSFAKIIGIGEINAANMGVGHPAVWEALKDQYFNPLDFMDKWEGVVLKSLQEEEEAGKWRGITEGEAVKWLEKLEGVMGKTKDALGILGFLQNKGITEKEAICDIDRMKTFLETNLVILQQAMELRNIYQLQGKNGLMRLKEYFSTQREAFQNFNVKNLTFDYSSLTIEDGCANPFDSLKSKLSNGLFDLLLLEEERISNLSLGWADARYQLTHSKKTEEEWEAKDIEGVVNEKGGNALLGFLTAFLGQAGTGDALKENVDKITKNILLNEYASLYLKGFADTGNVGEKETKIRYEREYVVFGKEGDRENLTGMVNRLVLIRTGVNLMHILSDSAKREETYATAAALVGFSCMEALVRLTQIVLMVGWAWEEAVVDVAALMKGYEVPIIKTDQDFQIDYTEIPLFGKSLVKEKVESYRDTKGAGSFGYRDYLNLFLFLMDEEKKTCRMMDIMQENMKLRYRDDFTFDSCLFGLKVKASYKTDEGMFEKEWECAY